MIKESKNLNPVSPPPKSHRISLLSFEAWVFLFLTFLSCFVVFSYVDLTPHIGKDFFFSTDDPLYQADHQISQSFERKDSQIIINVAGPIDTPLYQDKIKRFSDILLSMEGMKSVSSLTHGPRGLRRVLQSPFWSRLLVPEDRRSTNVVIIMEGDATSRLIPKVENLLSVFNAEDFQITMSGAPYVAELIRRYLRTDLQTFSVMAFAIFGMVIIFIFHSWRILVGMLVTCLNAGMITFMITNLLNIKVGILTANLLTIVFVLTLSHIVFLTFNWQGLRQADADHPGAATRMAVRLTWQASFWCSFTTVLGFASCLLVPAKPLKELGFSGAIGTAITFIVAYTIYPSFLRLNEAARDKADHAIKHHFRQIFSELNRFHYVIITGIVVFLIIAAPELDSINTDPSLFSYFSPASEISKGLTAIDQSGGSSPLILVVKDPEGKSLATNEGYRRLWALQEALEAHPDTGVVLSLPTLMSEGKRSFFFFLVGWKRFFHKLEQPRYAQIGKSFITPDRKQGMFLIRMKELTRSKPRTEVVEEIKKIVYDQHFTPSLLGGIYVLEGHLSHLVASGLVFGLGRLLFLFLAIAFLFSLSPWTTVAVAASITLIPLSILGGFGLWKIPLDIISAPASNVAIGIGIDNMIHMTAAYRRMKKQFPSRAETWAAVRGKMWEPVITSMLIVSMGFGIFIFSSFPPTRRFGVSIASGTVIAALTALFIFPLLAGGFKRRPRTKAHPPQHADAATDVEKAEAEFFNRIKNIP